MWYERTILPALLSAARMHPVVAIVGPRQAGKTSLLRRAFPDAKYVALDEPGAAMLASDDPKGLLRSGPCMILDEIQSAPELMAHIKAAVDEERVPGRFLLTGSQNLLVTSAVAESLAGRAVYRTLLPFDPIESMQAGEQALHRCAYPEPFTFPERQESWLEGFVQTYLHRDVRSIANVHDLRDFSRFLRMLALRNTEMLNVAAVARDVSVAPNTVKSWISVLEASYQVFLLEPYFNNLTKRAIKTPKLYFVDPEIAWHLAGGKPRDPGKILEARMVAATHRWLAHTGSMRLFYFRTKEGVEVDLVLEPIDRNRRPLAVEIKNTHTFSPALLRGLKNFCGAHEAEPVLVSHVGPDTVVPGPTRLLGPVAFLKWLPELTSQVPVCQ